MKKVLLFVLSVFLITSATFAKDSVKTNTNKNDSKYIVYYFMYLPRCMTCNKIEKSTKEIVFNNFKKQLDSGLVQFKTVDVGKSENAHFTKDFKLFTKSVVLVEEKDGKVVKHEVLQKVWEYIHSPEKFSPYIIDSVKNFIK